MADETEQPGFTPRPFVPAPESPTSSASPAEAGEGARDPFAERPEVYVGAAFAGGLAIAGLLRVLGR